jgi:hypothetical protein
MGSFRGRCVISRRSLFRTDLFSQGLRQVRSNSVEYRNYWAGGGTVNGAVNVKLSADSA